MLWSAFHRCSCNTIPRIITRIPSRSFHHAAPRRSVANPLVTPSPAVHPGPQPSLAQKIGRPAVRNQVIFAVVGSCVLFSYAAAATNVETDEWVEKLTRGRVPRTWPHTITSQDMKRASDLTLAQELRERLKRINSWTEGTPIRLRNLINIVCGNVAQSYFNVTEGKRLCWKICLFNIGIWLAWKSRRLQPAMLRNFVHDPLSGKSVTMLYNMFSQRSVFILALNCLLLDGFGSSASFHLLQQQERSEGPLEATAVYHFFAFFVTAGLFAALTSHIIHLKIIYPRLISQLSSPSRLPATPDTWASALRAPTASTSRLRSFFRSVFSSSSSSQPKNQLTPRISGMGAMYALMMITALGFPSAELALFYPPNYSVPVQWGVGSVLLLDVIGILRGWKLFDHFAHLGGAAFGAFYYVYGPRFWNWLRVGVADPRPEEEKPTA
ncbi:hypothetical protein C8J57DRAFT_1298048 [Mycena rebaudengoi]|nr:hypothetical protein C8J57DRAFT_1298048 [Mycena rebaudengoi]